MYKEKLLLGRQISVMHPVGAETHYTSGTSETENGVVLFPYAQKKQRSNFATFQINEEL